MKGHRTMAAAFLLIGSGAATMAAALEKDADERRKAIEDDADAIVNRPTASVTIERPRDYDIEGPVPKAGPPEAKDAPLPMTRQQRRYLERQARKHR